MLINDQNDSFLVHCYNNKFTNKKIRWATIIQTSSNAMISGVA